MSDKITEVYDLLCDLNFPDNKHRSDYLIDGIPEENYQNGLVNYNADLKRWTINLPYTVYEFSYIGFKAFKPIPLEGVGPNKVFYCCAQANNTSKRVAFDYSNLTDGIEVSPLNQVTTLDIWINDPIYNKNYTLNEVSGQYHNLVIEIDLYIRK